MTKTEFKKWIDEVFDDLKKMLDIEEENKTE